MKFRTLKRFAAAGLAVIMTAGMLTGCGGKKAIGRVIFKK